jgi:glycolate oxidase FAD binding subunit
MTTHKPTTIDQLVELIATASAEGRKLELRGGSSKAAIGAARDAEIVDMRNFSGVVDYDPPELVLTVGAGTPLAEVQALVASKGQMLAFEPFDHGPLFGRPAGAATIGGVVAAGIAGSGRLTAGSARDHLLGFTAVSGRAERFVGGGKVVKNVTGYDLPKLVAASWGRLVAVTELTLKVLPRPRVVNTMAIEGLDHHAARAAMAAALGSPAEISAAAHLPAGGGQPALTLFRVQGFAPSVAARCAALPAIVRDHGAARLLSEEEAEAHWATIREVGPLADAPSLWRVNLPPSGGPKLVDALEPHGAHWLFDWAGGLVWLGFDGEPALVRKAAETAGGHAMLVRALDPVRNTIPFQHPRALGVAALEARVRRAFDPAGVFETDRFLDHINAH